MNYGYGMEDVVPMICAIQKSTPEEAFILINDKIIKWAEQNFVKINRAYV